MKYKKTAIIFGITGQDGVITFLIQKGYKVIGTTRNKSVKIYILKKLKIINSVKILKGVVTDINFVIKF